MEQWVKIIDFCESIEFKDKNKLIAISPNLKHVCLWSASTNAQLFTISSCTKPVLLWTSTANVDRCIFSEDGYQLLVVLESSILHIYDLKNDISKLTWEPNIIQLTPLLGKFGIGLTAESVISPLNFSQMHIIISVNNKWLVSLKWLNLNQLYVVYTVEANSSVTPVSSNECVYFLTSTGNILAYSLMKGKQLGTLNLHTSIPPNNSDTPRTFKRITVSQDGSLLAVADHINKVYILNTEAYFLSPDHQDLGSHWPTGDSDTMSVCSGMSYTSTRTTTSVRSHRLGSAVHPKGNTSYKSTWNTYLSLLQKPKPAANKRPHIVCLSDLPTHLDVKCLSITTAGIAIWLNHDRLNSGGVCQLYDVKTGLFLAEQQLEENMVMVERGLATQMDAFVSPDGISLFLGTLFRDVLVKKLVHCIETKSLGQLLKCDEWGDIVVPLPLLATSLKQSEVDVARLALSLHAHAFKSAFITNPSEDDLPYWQNRIDNVVAYLDKLFDVIHAAIQESGDKLALSEQLLSSALDHANDLLGFLEESSHGIEAVKKQVLNQVIKLRVHLKRQREETVEEAEEALGDHRSELAKWKTMEDSNVIRLAISQNNVPMVHTYLSNSHGWNRKKVEATIQAEFDVWLHELLVSRDFETSKQILLNIEHKDPLEKLKSLCFQMTDKDLRDNLAEYLASENVMTEEEIKSWEFLKLIENSLVDPVGMPGTLVISNLLHQTSESRSMILVELYLKTYNVHLKNMISPQVAWKYFLQYNRKDLLIEWIQAYFTPHQEHSQTTGMMELFPSWEITQDMVNFVNTSESMGITKDSVLDHLSTRGIFCEEEKHQPGIILQRLIRTNSLHNLDNILMCTSSNVTIQEFYDMLAAYCVKHKVYGMAFPCLVDREFTEEKLAVLSSANGNKIDWFKLWLTFRDWFKDPLNENLALKAITDNLSFLSEDSDVFLQEHPLLVIALILYGQQTIENVVDMKVPEHFLVDHTLLNKVLPQIPLLQMALAKGNHKLKPDITVYQLLRDTSAFDVSRLFKWQENRDKGEMPHFSAGKLVSKYGYRYSLNYTYYLKQGRPSFAANLFLVDQFQTHRNISRKVSKQVCNIAHGTALENFHNQGICAACISFIEMLGRNSEVVRVHVSCGNIILSFLNAQTSDSSRSQVITSNVEQVDSLLLGLVANKKQAAPKILSLLELALEHTMDNIEHVTDTVALIKHWNVAVKFSRIHSLKLPEKLLRLCAKKNMWFLFILFIDLHGYPVDEVLHLVKCFSSVELQEHLSHALGNISTVHGQEATLAKSKLKLQLRDSRKTLYSRIGLLKKEISPDNQSTISDSQSSMQISSSSSEDAFSVTASTHGGDVAKYDIHDDLFLVLLKCHRSSDPPRALLTACKTLENPLLAVLATCYEPSSSLGCFCMYLLTSMGAAVSAQVTDELSEAVQQHVWSSHQVEMLLMETVATGHVTALEQGCKLFLPESPLCAFSECLMQCIVKKSFKESIMNIKLFKASCLNLKNNPSILETSDFEETFLINGHWISSVAINLTRMALKHCFDSSYLALMFLRTLCEASFSDHLPVAAPDYCHLAKLVECLSCTGVHADLGLLCLGSGDQYQTELMHCLDQLIEIGEFQPARSLASLTGLGMHRVVVSQWSCNFQSLCQDTFKAHVEGDVVDFWEKCEEDFSSVKMDPSLAAQFYYEKSEKAQSLKQKYHMLQSALTWLRKINQPVSVEEHCINKSNLSEDRVELEMWKCWLQIDEIVPTCSKTPLKPYFLCSLKSEILKASQDLAEENHVILDSNKYTAKLDVVIETLLDHGDVSNACKIGAMFNHNNQDLNIILTCLGLAEGDMKPYQLSADLRMLLTEPRSSSGISYRRRTLQNVGRSSTSSSKYEVPLGCSISSDFVVLSPEGPSREQQDTLSVLESLTERLRHGTRVASRIVMCYRVAMMLDRTYQYVFVHENPLSLLKLVISSHCPNKFIVVSDLLSAAQTTPDEAAELMSSEIVTAITKLENMLWGCDLNTSFHLVLELCPDSSLLGNRLLSIASKMADETQNFSDVVELLIRSHDCYTSACNMEGIAAVLHFARAIADCLLQKQLWALLVRLLIGVGRYTEMSYIFQMLKDNEQFEYLLGKGMDKVSGLKLAVLEFLKQHCPQNRELFRMVALHFALYTEVAMLWKKEGESAVHSLLSVASLGQQPSSPVILCNTEDTKQCLHTSMQSFTHAAEHYLLADKLTRASAAAYQAELLALQISLVNSVPIGEGALSVLELTAQQVTHIITHKLSFPQAWIVARAYSHPVDWGAALYQQCLVQASASYLTDFTETMALTPALVEDVVRRFQQEPHPTMEMAKQMKKMLSHVNCVEVVYRVASQLGFKDVIDNLLSGPELPYLKDTVWRSGYSRKSY